MGKEVEVFEIPTNDEEIKDHFYEINIDYKTGKQKKRMKETPKQFKAAVKILKHLLTNKDRAFSKNDLIKNTTSSVSSGDNADIGELTPDAYKHAITLLSQALIITNVHAGKTTQEWGFNPNIEIYSPNSDTKREKKAHVVVGSIYSELSYDNFEIARDILKSKLYELHMPSFYGYNLKEKDDTPICDPEKIPYWKEEMEFVKQGGYSTQEEFNELMYQRTGDDRYLSESAKDMFVF